MTTLFLALVIARHQPAAFEYRESGPASLFNYSCAVSDGTPLSNLLNPAYLPLWDTLYLSAAYSRPYMLSDLNATGMFMGASAGRWGIQAGWNSFGMDEYMEHTISGDVGLRISSMLSTGIGIDYFRLIVKTEDLSSGHELTDFHGALLFMPFRWLHVGFLQEHALGLHGDARSDLLYPHSSFGVSLKPARGVSLLWNINRTYYGFINTVGLSANLLPFLGFRAGYSRETSSWAASVTILHRYILASYSMRYHSLLGATHSMTVTFSTRGLTLEEIQYTSIGKRRARLDPPEKCIDINNAPPEELLSIPGLREDIVERIMKYREALGPLSPKALVQIGLSEREAEALQDYACGLVGDKERRNHAERFEGGTGRNRAGGTFRAESIDRRREVFQKLLQAGIPAGTALRIAETAKDKRKADIIEEVRRMSDLPAPIRRSIIDICAETL
jgi:hypothetical protein